MARYCIFSAQYVPHVGGIERYTEQLSKTLVSRGHEVDIVTNNTEGAEEFISIDGLTVVRLPCISLFSGRFPLPKPCGSRSKAISWIYGRCYDGVLINARFYPHSLLGMSVARKQGLRPVVLDHGSAYLTFGNKVIDIAVRAYEHCITAIGKLYGPHYYGVSRRSVEWLQQFGIKGEGILPNSIDAKAYRDSASSRKFREEIGVAQDELMISYVGRLIPEKGIFSLLKAAKECDSLGLRVRFVIAGSGPLEGAVCSASDNVTYVGKLLQSDVSALLIQSDVFCLPSRSEGFATCLLEAGACGTPAITTDVGGAREVMPDGDYGLMLESSDAEKIVSSIRWCIGRRRELAAMGDRLQERVDNKFSWEEAAERVEDALRSK